MQPQTQQTARPARTPRLPQPPRVPRTDREIRADLKLIRFGVGKASEESKEAVDRLLDTPRALQKNLGIRIQHFHSEDTGRLVGTIATRLLPDGTIDVAASIVNENQGRGNEAPPSRRFGCRYALIRLMEGNKDGLKFTESHAQYLLERGPNTEVLDTICSPKDIKVVNFHQDALRHVIKHRSVLGYFPGQQWLEERAKLDPIRKQQQWKPRKERPAKPPTLFQRFKNLFA